MVFYFFSIFMVTTSVIFNMLSGIVLVMNSDESGTPEKYSPRWLLDTYTNYSILGYLGLVVTELAALVIGLFGTNWRILEAAASYGAAGLAGQFVF